MLSTKNHQTLFPKMEDRHLRIFTQFYFLTYNSNGDDNINLKSRNKLLLSQNPEFSLFIFHLLLSDPMGGNIFIWLAYLMYKRHKHTARQLQHDNVKNDLRGHLNLFPHFIGDDIVDPSQLVNCRLRLETRFSDCRSDFPTLGQIFPSCYITSHSFGVNLSFLTYLAQLL